MQIFLYCAVSILALLTIVPLSHNPKWWVRGLDFPRLQFALVSLLLLAIELLVLNFAHISSWILFSVTTACFIYQALWIFPYTKLHSKEVQATSNYNHETISIITANVLMTNRNARQLIHHIETFKPDIFVTLETNQWWQSHLDKLEQSYPHTIKCPLENLYGMHVYSKLPLENTGIQYLIEDDVPSMHAKAILSKGTTVRLHFLHPAPPSPTENEESAERDAELIMVAKNIAETAAENQPVIVTGDMNDVAWSRTTRLFRKLSGLLDPRVGRGMFNTFHAKYWFLRWPLDHLFHTKHFTLDMMKRLPAYGSDHFALYTQLSLEPQQSDQQSGIDKEDGDEQLADATLSEKNVVSRDVTDPT